MADAATSGLLTIQITGDVIRAAHLAALNVVMSVSVRIDEAGRVLDRSIPDFPALSSLSRTL